MLKLGITRLDDLERPKAPSGRLRHASLLLLRDLAAAEHAAPEAYDTLVARVKMPNGTWRQTAAGRLQQVDDLLLAELRPAMRRGARFRVLDLGVSTGVTSADLYERLRGECQVDFVASDLYRDLYAVRSLRLGWVVILDHLGHDVQYVVGRLVLPAHIDEARVYVANRLVKALARRIFLPEARRVLAAAAAEGQPYFVTTVVLQHEVARLPFFAFRCLDLARREPGFRFEAIDVTHPIPVRADVVRAMNLVTTDYFDAARARVAIANVLATVEPGGLLVMGRGYGLSPDDVHATVYRVDGARVTPLARLNRGDEMEAFVATETARARASAG